MNAEQKAAQSAFDFLIDLVSAQRAISEYVMLQGDDERQSWIDRAEEHCEAPV